MEAGCSSYVASGAGVLCLALGQACRTNADCCGSDPIANGYGFPLALCGSTSGPWSGSCYAN